MFTIFRILVKFKQLSAYLELSGATNRKIKTAIYSEAHNFIAETEEKTVSSTGWYNFQLCFSKANFDSEHKLYSRGLV